MDDLKQRFSDIEKSTAKYLKGLGFKKIGKNHIKQKESMVLEIKFCVTRPWLHGDESCALECRWSIHCINQQLIELSQFFGARKSLKWAFLMGQHIHPAFLTGKRQALTRGDGPGFDQAYSADLRKEIDGFVLPLFERIHCFEDVINLAENETSLEKRHRKLFPYTIYDYLARFYAAKGWRKKALEMCDKHMEETPPTARDLAEADKRVYMAYFEKYAERVTDE